MNRHRNPRSPAASTPPRPSAVADDALPADVRNIILTGFMGVGKSTVGRRLAKRLGWTFLDTDALIEREAGKSIERIFAEDGEAAFRAREADIARRLASFERHVIATGGGMAVADENRRALERAGALVLLATDADTIWRRVRRSTHRPLLRRPDARAEIDRLLAARSPAYDRIRLRVDAGDGPIEEKVDLVLACIQSSRRGLTRVHVELGPRRYPIEIGRGWLERLGAMLEPWFPPRRCLLVTNPTVGQHWARPTVEALAGAGYRVEILDIPDGEAFKTMATVGVVLDALADGRFDRHSGVVALGGGVVGDIAGFAAAIFLRGVPFLQLPTSLLAMVDSSVGGKTGVNHPRGKNLIGAFWQPTFVGIELAFLDTLPDEELRAGMAEVIKYGAIADAAMLEDLERSMDAALRRDPDVLRSLVARSCAIKARVVAGDEREESGLRAILNFGHTFGHAVETLTGYRSVRHGEAVAMGMVAAARLAAARGMIDAAYATRLERLIARAGLPTRLPRFEPEAYWTAMGSDKKAREGRIRFVLPTAPGEVKLVDDVAREEVFAVLAATMADPPRQIE